MLISFLAALVFHHGMSNMKVSDIKPSGIIEIRKKTKEKNRAAINNYISDKTNKARIEKSATR